MNDVYVMLGDVCSKESSNIAQKDLSGSAGMYPIYGASGWITNVNFYQQEQQYIAIVKDGAGVGRAMILPAKSSVIGTLQYIIPNAELADIQYLYFAIVHMNLGRYFSGATIPHIYFRDYKKEHFRLPSMARQKLVADVLRRIEQLIKSRQKQLFLIDALVKSRFIEMFGDIPKSEYVSMNKVCSIITDGTHQPPKFISDGIPFIFVSNLANNEVTYNAEKYITDETYNELIKRTPIEVGDILLSTVGSYGHPAVVKNDKRFLFQRHIAYLKPKRVQVDSIYLYGFLLSADGQQQIEERVKGIAQKTLNLSEIKKLMLPLPTMDTQTQFSAFVQQVDKSKFEIQKGLETLETLKKALMQQYFG